MQWKVTKTMNRTKMLTNDKKKEENIILKCMCWNVRGWRGKQDKEKRKMSKIKSEIEGYDVIILTETHLSKEEKEIEKMEKYLEEHRLQHVHAKIKPNERKGVTVGIKKKLLSAEEVKIETDEGLEDEGRWIKIKINKLLDQPLTIWGIYSPAKLKERKAWLKNFGEVVRQEEGYKVIAGDFNFVMNPKLDKIGGSEKSGMIGAKDQEMWEREFGMSDVWREQHPGEVGTTWSNNFTDPRRVIKTRIDRAMVDERIADRVTKVEIKRTRVSDHDAVEWHMATNLKRKKNHMTKYQWK